MLFVIIDDVERGFYNLKGGIPMKKFDTMIKSETIAEKYRSDHWMQKSITGFVSLVITVLADTAVLYNFILDNRIPISFTQEGLIGIGTLMAFLMVFDAIIPMIFLMIKRQVYCVEKTPTILLVIGIVAVILFIAGMLLIRIKLVTPELLERGVRSYEQAVILGILPIGTSLFSGFMFWMSYNPLRTQLLYLEQTIFSEKEKIRDLNAKLAMFDLDNDAENYKARLSEEEEKKFYHKRKELIAMAEDWKMYFRLKLAERLAEPAAAERLSMRIPEFNDRDQEQMSVEERWNGKGEIMPMEEAKNEIKAS